MSVRIIQQRQTMTGLYANTMMQFLGDVDKLIQQQKLNSPTDYNASSADSAKQAAGEVGTVPSGLLPASGSLFPASSSHINAQCQAVRQHGFILHDRRAGHAAKLHVVKLRPEHVTGRSGACFGMKNSAMPLHFVSPRCCLSAMQDRATFGMLVGVATRGWAQAGKCSQCY
jgi:hypothetical protein